MMRDTELSNPGPSQTTSALTDAELLASALHDALNAHQAGVIAGPGVDEVALRRAERQARRADAARSLSASRDGAA
jgi:hypothetical protein